jgi:hypothetical protein
MSTTFSLKIVTTVEIDGTPTQKTMSFTTGVKAVRLVKTAGKCGAAVLTDNEYTTFAIVCENIEDALKLISDFSAVAETRYDESYPDKPITLTIKQSQYCEYN